MFLELERLAEMYGVETAKIPAFLDEFVLLTGMKVERETVGYTRYTRYVTDWIPVTPHHELVEDYHGKARNGLA